LTSDGNNALLALEAELIGQRKIYLFGELFSGADQGVHDVHQNQGDPSRPIWPWRVRPSCHSITSS
jgi:hypothetical protein